MTPVTVLYEDSAASGSNGHFPLHDMVMRMVQDDAGPEAETWRLRQATQGFPRKGVDNVLADVRRTSMRAGRHRLLILIDRDRIARHLKLDAYASDDQVVAAIRARSDAPDRLDVFFLYRNAEDVIRDLGVCGVDVDGATLRSALGKRVSDRDVVFTRAVLAGATAVRHCLRQKQPGLDALAKAIAALLAPGVPPSA